MTRTRNAAAEEPAMRLRRENSSGLAGFAAEPETDLPAGGWACAWLARAAVAGDAGGAAGALSRAAGGVCRGGGAGAAPPRAPTPRPRGGGRWLLAGGSTRG